MSHVALVLLVILPMAVLGVLAIGSYRWNLETQVLRAQLEANRQPGQPETVDFAELEGLPPLVQRFFPGTKIKPGLTGNWSGMDSTKAARELGFRAEHTWETVLKL